MKQEKIDKNKDTVADKREEFLKLLNETIKEFKYTTEEKKAYFKELHNLFIQANWKHLLSWDRVEFFKRWFVAVSDECAKADIKFELLKKQFFSNKTTSRKALKLSSIRCDDDWLSLNEGIEADCLLWGAIFRWGMSIGKLGREFGLKEAWNEDTSWIKDKFFGGSSVTPFPPVVQTTIEEATAEKEFLCDYAPPDVEALKFFLVNVQFPTKVILKQIKEIVEKEREKYFSKFSEYKAHFTKKTKDGREDTYPFDEWERYLKIYMLKQQGKTTRELTKQFYSEKHANPERQVLRDNQKAKKLSKNALAHNFPGKY